MRTSLISALFLYVAASVGCDNLTADAGEPPWSDGGVTRICRQEELRSPSGEIVERCDSPTGRLPSRLCGNCTVVDAETVIAMQGVETIEGDLRIAITGADAQVRLPNLRSVQSVSLSGGSVAALSLPGLESADSFRLEGSPRLREIDADGLVELRGAVQIDNMDTLTSVSFRALERASTIRIESCPRVETINFDNLLSTEFDVSITRIGARAIEFPALLSARRLTIAGTENIEVRFPALAVVDWLSVRSNLRLTHVDFPSLVDVGAVFEISNNPVLPEEDICEVLELIEGAGLPSSVNIGEAVCS